MMDFDSGVGGARTLYVGNLDISVTEDLILALFGQVATPLNPFRLRH
jgi:hypothetical protein